MNFKRIKPFALLVIIIFFVSLFPFNGLANGAKAYSSNHAQYANFLTKKNKIILAVEQYIKALLLNSGNEEAASGLKELIRSADSLDNKQRALINRFIGLIDFLNFLMGRIHQIALANASLIEFISQNLDPQQTAGLTELASLVGDQNLYAFPQIMLAFEHHDQNFHLASINDKLTGKKEQYVRLLENFQAANDKLRDMKRQIIANYQAAKEVRSQNLIQAQIVDLEQKMDEKNQQIYKQERILDVLSQQLMGVRLEFDEVKQKLVHTDERVISLTRDLAGMSLAAYEKDRLIADKENLTRMLETELFDAQERLNLMQKIMTEKDTFINNLERQVNEIQVALEKNNANADLGHLRDAFADLQQKMKTETLENHSQMNQLKQDFQDLQKRYLVLEKSLELKDSQISELSATLSEKEKRISQMQQIFISKDQKLIELSSILEIYKSKLAETYRSLEQKIEILEGLEKKLTQLSERVELKQQVETERQPSEKSVSEKDARFFPRTLENIYQRTKDDLSGILQK